MSDNVSHPGKADGKSDGDGGDVLSRNNSANLPTPEKQRNNSRVEKRQGGPLRQHTPGDAKRSWDPQGEGAIIGGGLSRREKTQDRRRDPRALEKIDFSRGCFVEPHHRHGQDCRRDESAVISKKSPEIPKK